MSSYRRFISYMYEYQQGQKKKNCGFVKVEIKTGQCVMHFQLKGISCQEKCRVYLYCPEKKPVYLFLREIPVTDHMIHYRLNIDDLHMALGDAAFSDCHGLLCTDEKGNDYGTCWEGDKLPEYRAEKNDSEDEAVVAETAAEPAETVAVETAAEPAETVAAKIAAEPTETVEAETTAESASESTETVAVETAAEPAETVAAKIAAEPTETIEAETTAESASESAEAAMDEYAGETETGTTESSPPPRGFFQLWEYMQKEFPHMAPFEDHAIVEAVKIAPSDLGYLQTFDLNLGNNQFLLHGYQTYQHLLLGRLHGQMRYVLGIPGIYDQQEQFMAKMFGFPCFKPLHESRQKNGQFGYWLRCFKEKRD